MAGGEVARPDVSALELGEIVVQAPRPRPPSEVELLQRLAFQARELAKVTPRAEGEKVQAGDELVLDLLLLTPGGVIEGGALGSVRLWASHPTLGFVPRRLVGSRVGEAFRHPGQLPADYPVQHLQNRDVVWLGRLRRAEEVVPIDLDDPAQRRRLGMGEGLPEILETLGEDLLAEAEADVATAVREAVFDELLARVNVEAKAAWIDVGRAAAFEQRCEALFEALAPERLDEARQQFVDDPLGRAIEERKLKVTLILQALCVRDGVQLTGEAVTFAVERVAEMMGTTSDDVVGLVKTTPELDHQVTNLAMQLVAIHHVLEAVVVRDPPKRLSALGARMLRWS